MPVSSQGQRTICWSSARIYQDKEGAVGSLTTSQNSLRELKLIHCRPMGHLCFRTRSKPRAISGRLITSKRYCIETSIQADGISKADKD